MTPVDNAYISYTQTFPQKEFFATKNIFFLLICLHLHLIKSHQGEDIHEKKMSAVLFT